MWPLIVICLLLCIIAGFFMWILDTWKNKDDFPRPFFAGMMEGFWWGFVSMTTVGFGDRTPKSLPGRVFAVVWILIGVTVISIFVGTLASEIMQLKKPETPELKGKTVGALEDRLFESLIIAQHGGILKEIAFNNTISGITDLVIQLKKKTIDGFLVTKPTYHYYCMTIKDNSRYKQYDTKVELTTTVKDFTKDQLFSGILVNESDINTFFRRYYESNWVQIQGCFNYELNSKVNKFTVRNRFPMDTLFVPFLGGTLVFVAAIAVFGIIYEVQRKKRYISSIMTSTAEVIAATSNPTSRPR